MSLLVKAVFLPSLHRLELVSKQNGLAIALCPLVSMADKESFKFRAVGSIPTGGTWSIKHQMVSGLSNADAVRLSQVSYMKRKLGGLTAYIRWDAISERSITR